jgi:hypothetical protein
MTAHCPHCGASLDGRAPQESPDAGRPELLRYDLEELAALALAEKAYDETVKVRVSQDDIRKLVAKRRKTPK